MRLRGALLGPDSRTLGRGPRCLMPSTKQPGQSQATRARPFLNLLPLGPISLTQAPAILAVLQGLVESVGRYVCGRNPWRIYVGPQWEG